MQHKNFHHTQHTELILTQKTDRKGIRNEKTGRKRVDQRNKAYDGKGFTIGGPNVNRRGYMPITGLVNGCVVVSGLLVLHSSILSTLHCHMNLCRACNNATNIFKEFSGSIKKSYSKHEKGKREPYKSMNTEYKLTDPIIFTVL